MINDYIPRAIIDPEDIENLQMQADAKGVRIIFLDASFVLPGSGENLLANYQKERIPGALFFDIEDVSDKSSPLPHMLPNIDDFNKGLSALGIMPDDILVIYGQHGMVTGPARVWWMMRVFGHDRVLVLNGGLPAWRNAGLPLSSDTPITPFPSSYRARCFHSEMVTHMQNVLSASQDASTPILDARPKARFEGNAPEPRSGMRSGHIPGSYCLPSSMLVDPERGRIKDADALRSLFEEIGIDLDAQKGQRIILSCGSGITACALALSLYVLGHEEICVYDGSWSEWGQENTPTPVSKG